MSAHRMRALILEMDGGPSGTWWELSTVADNGPLTDDASGLDAEVAALLSAGSIGQAVTVLGEEGYEVVLHSLAWWNEVGSLEQDENTAAEAMEDIRAILYPAGNSDAEWTAGTIEDVAAVVDAYTAQVTA